MAKKLIPLVDHYRRLASPGEDYVLATILETQGSTYQKAGARMLISKDGECLGMLSGGCFESDLMERARTVFETGLAVTVFFDMRSPDDVVWGLGLGCNGAVKILLQLLKADKNLYPLDVLADAVAQDRRGVLMTVIESAYQALPAGQSLFWSEDHFKKDQWPWPAELMPSAGRTPSDDKPYIETCLVEGNPLSVFYAPVRPLSRLLIMGAGTDAVPLVQCANTLGWRVTVVDHRPALIKPERFPLAEHLIYCLPQNLADTLQLDRFDALVMMTHSFEYDARYLRIFADSHIPFIGLLGPEARKNRLLDSLGNNATKLADRVFGPIGLDIGAETPEEIALSIMAGILAAQNRRHGGQLTSHTAFES